MFVSSFEKTAVSREWVMKNINKGLGERATSLAKKMDTMNPSQREAVHKQIDKHHARLSAREKALGSEKLSDKAFKNMAKKQISDIRSAHSIPKPATPAHKIMKSKYLKPALIGGGIAAAAGGALALHHHKQKKESFHDREHNEASVTA